MNRDELIQFANRLQTNYSYNNQLPNNFKDLMIEWKYSLEKRPAQLVNDNLTNHLEKSIYFPKLADLVKCDEEKEMLGKSIVESNIYISMLEEEENNIKPKSETELQKIKELKEKMNKLQRDGRKKYDERISRLFEL